MNPHPPVTAMEAVCDSQTCPATAPETMKALPVLSLCSPCVVCLCSPQISDSAMVSCPVCFPAVVFCFCLVVYCSGLVGSGPVCSALVGSGPVCSSLVGSGPVCSALVGSRSICSALVGSRSVCSALVCSRSVCSALVGYTSTWTWPSVPPPVPPPLHHPPGLFRRVWKPLLGGGAGWLCHKSWP